MTSGVKFEKRGDLTSLRVSTPYSECVLFPEQGAHVASFVPHGFDDILWVSSSSLYESGKAIRGGIPICWPWFGPHPSDSSLPNHGFARVAEWNLDGVEVNGGEGTTAVAMSLAPSDATRAMWPRDFRLEYVVVVGKTLRCSLTTTNLDDEPMDLTQALHTYFRVGDVREIGIEGFDGVGYIDALDGFERKIQKGAIRFAGNVDSVYVASEGGRAIRDESLGRAVRVSKTGSASDVVWNPWREKAMSMFDFEDDEYLNMVCLETSNAFDDKRVVAPGGSHTVSAEFAVEEL